MRKPHKHAEVIKAWADGAEIEVYDLIQENWVYSDGPTWREDHEYRIKPEPKPDVIEYAFVKYSIDETVFKWHVSGCDSRNLKLTFDGETGELKLAEVFK